LPATPMWAADYATDVITNVTVSFSEQTAPLTITDIPQVGGNVQDISLQRGYELAVLY